ncbi:methanol oxidation system protein MoxJ [Methylobacterium nodulans]|uniref:Extracellular solute-binding protein family 3 n=1 Tax=Methylobacterium nodulans (strain LMG 21967 / CNCM I-2342 / ORS 2060) TaxID=460265 RepID=B8IWZ2_METNO|nr:methanol oxidation system protein MoxJ [Methylobacterium nodulans]ACL63033.1 extracellular solute-binding protein family 3 [Methylobacterium nodulans ORS 2060]
MLRSLVGGLAGLTALAAAAGAAPATAPATGQPALRVCAAASQPPLSLRDGSGLENKVAAAVAAAMDRKVEFVWSDKPAIYLVRDFLDKKLCDVIAGLDTGDARVLTTRPYYRSGYVFISRQQDGLDVASWTDPRLKQVGHVAVPFGSPSEAMLKRIGRYEEDMAYLYSLVNFRSPRNQYTQIEPARLVEEVATGKAAIAAPFAPEVARFVKASPVPLRMTLIADDASRDGQKITMQFDQSMGVRRGDETLLKELEAGLAKAKPAIEAILKEEGVPTLPTGS